MADFSDSFEKKIIFLYNNKQFLELESEIEKISKEKRTNSLTYMLGISKYFKPNKVHDDLIQAQLCFKECYQNNENYIDAFNNLISTSLTLKHYNYLISILNKRKDKFGESFLINLGLAECYFFLAEIKKSIFYYKKIIYNKKLTLKQWSTFVFINNYIKPKSKNEYIKIIEIFNNKIVKQDPNKLVNLDIKPSDNKLRIGFISPDFGSHSIKNFIFGTLKHLKNENLELVSFSLLERKDKYLQNLFHEWNAIGHLNDIDLINFIREKKINILIDLSGHAAGNRIAIFKNKLAPIQIGWLGYCNSTGIEGMDYIIADQNLIKKNEKKDYTEKILYMPNIWNSSDNYSEELEINTLPAIEKNYFTFGCFNNFQKINPETIKLWSRILKETNSRLVLKTSMYPSKDLNEHTLNLFLEEGVNVDQVQILKRTKTIKEHLQLYNSIDLSLDTHPYPGVTTSFESIWMGVPVLTLRGFNFLSRCGESININLGLKNFICNDDDDFVNKAILLTKNLNYLNDLRINLRELAKKSHLFNSKNFAKDFSLNLKKTWNKYLENSI